MSDLIIENVSIDLTQKKIVDDVSFHLKHGQVGSLLGPSGCGKTTLLRTIAGFQRPKHGQVYLGKELVSGATTLVPPEKRNIGMVFQDLALFPHLSVARNIRFGIRHLDEKQQTQRLNELLHLVSLEQHADRYPHEISGGQQQRVALARALACHPHILLLDEPFSGQDVERRKQLANDIGNILRQEGVTALLVTHDQTEAFAFSDVVGVMNAGRLHQWDSAYNIYHRPVDWLVADFIGQGVFIAGKVIAHNQVATELGVIDGELTRHFALGAQIDLLIRPDDILHEDDSKQQLEIVDKSFHGANHLYTLKVSDNIGVPCLVPSHHNHRVGEKIGITFSADHLVAFERK